mgnify:FL=1
MDLVTGQRTYTLAVSAAMVNGVTEHFDIPFVDTAGNAIRCSYVEVSIMAKDASLAGIVAFELSGLVTEGNAVLNTLSSVTAIASPNASGVCGFGLPIGAVPNSYTWHGSQNQIVTGVRILPQQGGTTGDELIITLTYGNLYGLNSRRLEQSYDAGV